MKPMLAVIYDSLQYNKSTGDKLELFSNTLVDEDVMIFKSVRLLDTNGENIYANYSIIEFYMDNYEYPLNGIFLYDDTLKCFIIECLNIDKIFIYATIINSIKNIRVIHNTVEKGYTKYFDKNYEIK